MRNGATGRDSVYTLAEHLVNHQAEAVPPEVVEATKGFICDCLGVTIAGSGSPGCAEVAAQVAEWGGRPEATILTFGIRAPAFLAGFANSTMARALDLDDVYEAAINHVTCSVLPAALAMAEQTGRLSGLELIAAVALGRDLICRLGLANLNTAHERGRSQTYQYNTFAAAAVAGRYLGLGIEEMVAALGLAYGQGLSNRQGVIDGSMSVRVHQGLCTQLGLQAAQLARRGVTAARNVIDGKYGYYRLYEDGLYDPARLTEALGRVYTGIDSSIKPYPCCKQCHTAIEATLECCRALAAAPEEIAAIDVGLNADAYYTVCVPPEGRYRPQSVFDAQFSAPWTVAVAAVKGSFYLEDLEPQALQNPAALALAERISCRIDEEVEADSVGRISPAVVEVTLRDGRRARRRVDYVKGHPQNPMSFEEIVAKFWRGIPHAARPRDRHKMEEAVAMLGRLEQVEDVGELISLLA